MKKLIKFALIASVALVSVSCNFVLEETPRTIFVPSFFTTDAGVEGGLNRMYYHLRSIYGGQNMIAPMSAGTDEFTWGAGAEGQHKALDLDGTGSPLSASNNPASSIWNACFGNINTALGVIENAEANGVNPALIAEAYFFCAFDYFLLVQNFGGVPLDLGSGELKFNAAPSRVSVRNTVDEVYEKCVIPFFEKAVANLPDNPRMTGTVTKTTARLYLAKAYLTYAWWNENPNSIPTYPETSGRSASKAQGYFQKAYDTAVQGLNNAPSVYGLEETEYDQWKGPNKYSKEFLLFADYTIDNVQYGGTDLGYSGGGAPDNCAMWMINPNYPTMTYGLSPEIENNRFKSASQLTRAAEQGYGRPWMRMATVHGVFYKTFNNPHDSRLDVTFNLAYRQNYTRFGHEGAVVYGPTGQAIGKDGIVFEFLTKNQPAGTVKYYDNVAGPSQFGGGYMDGVAQFVVEPNHIGRDNFPGSWKLSCYRTDKADNQAGSPNSGNFRPLVIARFAEFYFVAAEAAIKLGRPADAKAMMVPIRERAGKWTYSVAEQQVVDRDYSAELVAEIPDNMTIDWLLDEYSREFFAECRRWLDLVRTQTWAERAATYQICDLLNTRNNEEKTYTRTIEKKHYLRPIPIGQLNGLEMTDEEKKAYQNPGYEN